MHPTLDAPHLRCTAHSRPPAGASLPVIVSERPRRPWRSPPRMPVSLIEHPPRSVSSSNTLSAPSQPATVSASHACEPAMHASQPWPRRPNVEEEGRRPPACSLCVTHGGLLPAACCLLPAACCPTEACCLLPAACCLLPHGGLLPAATAITPHAKRRRLPFLSCAASGQAPTRRSEEPSVTLAHTCIYTRMHVCACAKHSRAARRSRHHRRWRRQASRRCHCRWRRWRHGRRGRADWRRGRSHGWSCWGRRP